MGRTFFIKTYGCQMNLYDEGIVRELLKREGLVATKREEEADFLLILTCAVRRHAERRALGFLSSLVRLKRNHPTKRIGILGCLARALGEKAFAYGSTRNRMVLPLSSQLCGVATISVPTVLFPTFGEGSGQGILIRF